MAGLLAAAGPDQPHAADGDDGEFHRGADLTEHFDAACAVTGGFGRRAEHGAETDIVSAVSLRFLGLVEVMGRDANGFLVH